MPTLYRIKQKIEIKNKLKENINEKDQPYRKLKGSQPRENKRTRSLKKSIRRIMAAKIEESKSIGARKRNHDESIYSD
jgi:hypothetical protein